MLAWLLLLRYNITAYQRKYRIVSKLLCHDSSIRAVGQSLIQHRLPNVISIPFVSSQDELAEYYSLGDLFVCTSLADTTACTCLEAMGCGTPIAGFAEAGTPYVAPEKYAKLTPTFDVDALAGVIAETPKKTVARSKECIEYARGRYSRDVVFSQLESIYEKLNSEI